MPRPGRFTLFSACPEKPKPPKSFELPPAHTNNNTVAAYLAGRRIDPAVTALLALLQYLQDHQEIQNLIGPALEKFYERQVPAVVREFAEAMRTQHPEQAPQTPTRSGSGGRGSPTPKEIIGQEKRQDV